MIYPVVAELAADGIAADGIAVAVTCRVLGVSTFRVLRMAVAAGLRPPGRRSGVDAHDPRDPSDVTGQLRRPAGARRTPPGRRGAVRPQTGGAAHARRRVAGGSTGAAGAAAPCGIRTLRRRRIWSSGSSSPTGRTGCGSPTSPSTAPARAGCTALWCWTCSPAGSWAGRSLITCADFEDPALSADGANRAGHRRCTARKCGAGYAACEYSLIKPSRIFLRRTRAEARSTIAGPVSAASGRRRSRLW